MASEFRGAIRFFVIENKGVVIQHGASSAEMRKHLNAKVYIEKRGAKPISADPVMPCCLDIHLLRYNDYRPIDLSKLSVDE